MAEGSVIDGYKLDEGGSIVRTGVAENEEQQAGEDDAEGPVLSYQQLNSDVGAE